LNIQCGLTEANERKPHTHLKVFGSTECQFPEKTTTELQIMFLNIRRFFWPIFGYLFIYFILLLSHMFYKTLTMLTLHSWFLYINANQFVQMWVT